MQGPAGKPDVYSIIPVSKISLPDPTKRIVNEKRNIVFHLKWNKNGCKQQHVHSYRWMLENVMHRRADNFRPVSFTASAWEWVCATNLSRLQRETREREREREKQMARGKSTQCPNNSDPITSTSEFLLMQNSVIARLASDHRATELLRPIIQRCTSVSFCWVDLVIGPQRQVHFLIT
jgi:hypothetical protein